MKFPDTKKELACLSTGYDFAAGCDEAGRGPLAGPVVAACVILKPKDLADSQNKNTWYSRVRDSKTVPEKEREELALKIRKNALVWGIGEVRQKEIDEINIHNATLKAMRLAVEDMLSKLPAQKLPVKKDGQRKHQKIMLFVDGMFPIPESDPRFVLPEQECAVGGDGKILSVAAASILAKTHRDAVMRKLDMKFPRYGFARHKGYGTREHLSAIKKFGACPAHRKNFLKKR